MIPNRLILSVFVMILFANCKAKKSMTGEGSQSNMSTQTTESKTVHPKKEVPPIDGHWVFQYFPTVNTSKNILFPTRVPDLLFNTRQSKFNGSAGCNSVSGNISIRGNELTFAQPMLLTRMHCNASGEKIFLQALESVSHFQVNGNTLELMVGGKPAMVFERVQE